MLAELPLHQAQRQGLVHSVGQLLRVPRVDSNRPAEGLSASCELAEDQHPGAIVALQYRGTWVYSGGATAITMLCIIIIYILLLLLLVIMITIIVSAH